MEGGHNLISGTQQGVQIGHPSVNGNAARKISSQQIFQYPPGGVAGDGRDKFDAVARIDQSGGRRLLPVQLQHTGLGRLAPKDHPLAVHHHAQVLACPSQQVHRAVAVHHQQLQHGQGAAAEELGGISVEHDAVAVADEAQPGGNGDAQGGCQLRVVEVVVLRESADLIVVARQRHPALVHIQGLGHHLPQVLQLTAPSRQKQGGGRTAVQSEHPLGDLLGQYLGGCPDRFPKLAARDLLFHAQHVPVGDKILAQLGFHPLRRGEGDQVAPHQLFGDLIPGNGSHGVSHHSAVPAHRDIGGARANIGQHQI